MLALVPLGLLVAFYVREFGYGLGGAAWTAVLLPAGGHIGVGGALLWSSHSAVGWRSRWSR